MTDLNQDLDTALAPEVEVVGIFGWDSPALIQLKNVPMKFTVKELDEAIALARKILFCKYEDITAEDIKLLRKANGKPGFETDILISQKNAKGEHRSEVAKAWAVWEEFCFWRHKRHVEKDFTEPFQFCEYLVSNQEPPKEVIKAFQPEKPDAVKPFWFADGVLFKLYTFMPPATGHGRLMEHWKTESAIKRANGDDISLEMLKRFVAALDGDFTGRLEPGARPVNCAAYHPDIFEWRALREWLDFKVEEKSKSKK